MSTVSSSVSSQRIEGDISYSTTDFMGIANLLHSITGIRMNESNEAMVFSRLGKRVRDLGYKDFSAYLAKISDPKSVEEREYLVCALTTNTTHFFRESYHFEIFVEKILPDLIRRAREGERIRLWSAACSSGEEAYSLALCVFSVFPNVLDFDFKILATDIDNIILNRAIEGNYHKSSLKELRPEYFDLGFEECADVSFLRVNEKLRALVSFRHLNLIEKWPFSGRFDVIFCRNVAIYMDLQTQEMIWLSFSRFLRPGGHLFIGHSERLPTTMKSRFELVGKTTYRAAPLLFDRSDELTKSKFKE